MQKTNFPSEKTFSQKFYNLNWKILFILSYKQAKLREYFEFLDKSEEEKQKELYLILRKNLKYSFLEKIYLLFNKNYIWKIEKSLELREVLLWIMQNRFRVYQSIFTWVKVIWEKKDDSWPVIESAWLSWICKTYNISPTDLMNNYTLEQYFWFMDWIKFLNNDYSKEWKLMNNLALTDPEEKKNTINEAKKRFEKFKI